jgi:hypothetical protein
MHFILYILVIGFLFCVWMVLHLRTTLRTILLLFRDILQSGTSNKQKFFLLFMLAFLVNIIIFSVSKYILNKE